MTHLSPKAQARVHESTDSTGAPLYVLTIETAGETHSFDASSLNAIWVLGSHILDASEACARGDQGVLVPATITYTENGDG